MVYPHTYEETPNVSIGQEKTDSKAHAFQSFNPMLVGGPDEFGDRAQFIQTHQASLESQRDHDQNLVVENYNSAGNNFNNGVKNNPQQTFGDSLDRRDQTVSSGMNRGFEEPKMFIASGSMPTASNENTMALNSLQRALEQK